MARRQAAADQPSVGARMGAGWKPNCQRS